MKNNQFNNPVNEKQFWGQQKWFTVREYFKEVLIETETIVATIENAQDFLKNRFQGCDRNHSKFLRYSLSVLLFTPVLLMSIYQV